VTFQADKANVGARQHPGICRSMRLMTRLAAFKAHRCMLEREWTPFVAMAFEAPRLIGCEALQHGRTDAAVRIVAIHAGHAAFRKLVVERPLELGPLVEVTAYAQLVSGFRLADHQRLALVHFVTGSARNLIPGVAAFQPSDLCRLVQMAGEADFVGCRSRQVRRILDIIRRRSPGVRLAGTVTCFALPAHPPALGVHSQLVMRVLGEPVIDVFVTDLASVRSGVAGRKRCASRRANNSQEQY